MYLELRFNTWWAHHDIPRKLRGVFGRSRLSASLQTSDKEEAKRRSAHLLPKWRNDIARARIGTPADPVLNDAMYWRRELRAASVESAHEALDNSLAHSAQQMAERYASIHELDMEDEEEAAEAIEKSGAKRLMAIARGELTPLDTDLEDFLVTLSIEGKSRDQKRASILKFKNRFPHAQDISVRGLQEYINESAKEGVARATIKRHLSELRTYWKYLVGLEIVARHPSPFDGLVIPDSSSKAQAQNARRPFEVDEVARLLSAALEKKDKQLADLIQLAMYTGARLEELCALPLDKASDSVLDIEDAKSAAGWRQVPVHKKLAPVVKRLISQSTDGFLLSGLESENKYGDRSPGIGKRFGRLKRELGFPETKVFHSIRRTVATQFERAGVSESVAADIMGHDKPTMTYGLYSGRSSLEQRRKAVAKIKYPKLSKVSLAA